MVARKKHTVFLMLENMRLPSRTAETMVVKLSSVITMSEAFLVTSVPEPMAMPMSAVLSAGASFTPVARHGHHPSPRFERGDDGVFVAGRDASKHGAAAHRAAQLPCGEPVELFAVSTCSSRSAMPACRATASAVLAWSH